MKTHVKPGHTEPADGEERGEDEEQDRRDDLSCRIVYSSENAEQCHGQALPNSAEKHKLAPPDLVNEGDGDETREEEFRAIARRNNPRCNVVHAKALEKYRRIAVFPSQPP